MLLLSAHPRGLRGGSLIPGSRINHLCVLIVVHVRVDCCYTAPPTQDEEQCARWAAHEVTQRLISLVRREKEPRQARTRTAGHDLTHGSGNGIRRLKTKEWATKCEIRVSYTSAHKQLLIKGGAEQQVRRRTHP